MAVLLAKGMAHNVLNHPTLMRSTATLSSMVDNLALVRPDTSMLVGSGGIKATPAEMDAVADGLSLYMLARAGYSIDAAAPFWKRLAATYPASILNGYVANHPATAARLAAIEKTSADIKTKGSKKPPAR